MGNAVRKEQGEQGKKETKGAGLLSKEDLVLEVARKEKQIGELLGHIHLLEHEKANMGKMLHEILHSTSWKLTVPIRKTAEIKRLLFPLLRFRRKVAVCGKLQSIKREGNRLLVTGPTPSIHLECPQGIPQGWVALSADLSSKRGQLFFLLYYRTEEGFTGSQRFWLTLTDGGKDPVLVKLPPGIKELRLDPFDTEEEFSLSKITFHELGTLNLTSRIVQKYSKNVLSHPHMALHRGSQALQLVRKGGLHALRAKLFSDNNTHDYQVWVRNYDEVLPKDLARMKKALATLKRKPLISVILPTYNSPEEYLRKAIDSVLQQAYENWELCVADDCSSEPHVRRVLEEYAKKDSRIKVTFRTTNGHISEATNSALALARGEYVSFLDHDDELTLDALLMVAHSIEKNPHAKLLYSDEDKKTGYGLRFNPYFKSGWNPDFFLAQNYLCHLSTYDRALVQELGGLRKGFEGAQDWDLALRVVDAIDEKQIVHIPHILYHWRVIEGSTAQSTGYKPYVLEAQKKAVEEHLVRKKEQASVTILQEIAQLRVTFHIPEPAPKVSLIIPTRDMAKLLSQCVESIFEKTLYKAFDIVIVDNGSVEGETLDYFKELQKRKNVQILRDDRPFNFSRLNNVAVREVKTPLIGLLNNDLEVISAEWLEEMVSNAIRKEVGAVGARLYYPNNLLQHGGIILGIGGVAGHNHKGRLRHDVGYFNRIILPQNLSAVTAACLVMRKEVYEEVEGLDEENFQVAFNDVDFCLRIREKGYRIVYTPYAELYHHESASRGYETTPEKFARFEGEVARMKSRWGDLLKNDPYYNPNLSVLTEDFAFSFPPRVERFWKAK